METELTKNIKEKIHSYKPQLSGKMRTVRYADEVWTDRGIVDSIRFEDYVKEDHSYCAKIVPKEEDLFKTTWKDKCDGSCKIQGNTYPNRYCKGCVYHRHRYDIGMLITCFEIKITVSDFKSEHGHNFCGNHNYYVVPVEIWKEVLPLVPDGIGLLVYYPESGMIKEAKTCEYREVSKDLQILLLYNAMKKWCDGKQRFE